MPYNKIDQRACILYTLLWILYNHQIDFHIEGIGKFCAILLILYGLYSTFKVIKEYYLNAFLKTALFFTILLVVYGVWYILLGDDIVISMPSENASLSSSKSDYLKIILLSMCMPFVYYRFAHKGIITPKLILIFGWVFLAVSIFSFFTSYFLSPSGAFAVSDLMTNNLGYRFASLAIFAFFMPRNKLLYLLISLIFTFICLKRGAILIGAMAFVGYLFVMNIHTKGLRKVIALFISTLLIIGATYYIIDFYSKSSYFQQRFEQTLDGDSSGRDEIASKLWYHYNTESDVLNMWFGNGPESTFAIAGNFAHNDWLEVLINQGIIGVIIFASFVLAWIIDWYRSKRYLPIYYSWGFGLYLFAFILTSLFSMAYTGFTPMSCICIGLCLAIYDHNRQQSLINSHRHLLL